VRKKIARTTRRMRTKDYGYDDGGEDEKSWQSSKPLIS
jgi:hypothetical protein